MIGVQGIEGVTHGWNDIFLADEGEETGGGREMASLSNEGQEALIGVIAVDEKFGLFQVVSIHFNNGRDKFFGMFGQHGIALASTNVFRCGFFILTLFHFCNYITLFFFNSI